MTRSRRVLEAFVSGSIVYVMMAACSSSGKMADAGTTSGSATGGHTGAGGVGHGGQSGTGGTMGMGGTLGTGGAGGDSGIFDALMDPVSDAMAGVENPQSGARLKGKYLLGSDGSKQYQLSVNRFDVTDNAPFTAGYPGHGVQPVWFDSMLMTDCMFATATDGSLRCVPGVVEPPGESASYSVAFTDAQCTQPVLPMNTVTGFGCAQYAPPPYVSAVIVAQPTACAPTTAAPWPVHVYKVGAALSPPPTATYVVSVNGAALDCTAVGISQPLTWYTLTETAPATFVQGTAGIDP